MQTGAGESATPQTGDWISRSLSAAMVSAQTNQAGPSGQVLVPPMLRDLPGLFDANGPVNTSTISGGD